VLENSTNAFFEDIYRQAAFRYIPDPCALFIFMRYRHSLSEARYMTEQQRQDPHRAPTQQPPAMITCAQVMA
jgi:hypothetical protein